jgi:integrase
MSTTPKLASVPISPPRLDPGDILTPQELAKRLKVPVSWVYKHTDNSRKSRLPVSEMRGLAWEDFDGCELSVKRSVWGTKKLAEKLEPGSSVWGGVANQPKTKRSRASIPVVKQLADALNAHKLRAGILAQPALPIFQAGNGQPLNLDNLVRRVIRPALSRCAVCRKHEDEHKPEGHTFQRDNSLPEWHGWHAFRRGLATNLHALGVDDKTIQAILRHSNIGITQNIYIKSVSESQVNAMDTLSEKLDLCNASATETGRPVN